MGDFEAKRAAGYNHKVFLIMKKLIYPALEELDALRAKVAHRREYLELLEFELFNTRNSLQEFTQAYNDRLSGLEKELARLESLLTMKFEEEEKIRETIKGKQPRGWRHYSTGQRNGEKQAEKAEKEAKERHKKDPLYEQKIRELFRNLAKRFHPDLAERDSDKEEREKIMAEINQAYTARDLKALERLAQEAGEQENTNAIGPHAEILRKNVELRHLEGMIFEVEHTIREIDLSPAMQLRNDLHFENEAGRDFFADIENNLKGRIEDLKDHLLDLGVDEELVIEN